MADKKAGRQIGFWAFLISQIIGVGVFALIVFDNVIRKKDLNANIINMLLMYQGTVLGIIWGAVASKKFTPKHILELEKGD